MDTTPQPRGAEYYLRKYPRICSHIIAESLGYATPLTAALILKDAKEGKPNYCEWIYACYDADPRVAVNNAIRNRHYHRGYMAEYKLALKIVRRAIDDDQNPVFASWF